MYHIAIFSSRHNHTNGNGYVTKAANYYQMQLFLLKNKNYFSIAGGLLKLATVVVLPLVLSRPNNASAIPK